MKYYTALLLFLFYTEIALAQAGAPDYSFDDSSKTIIAASRNNIADVVLVQPDGKIVAAGYSANSNDKDIELTRLNSNGTLDSSFGINGEVLTDSGNTMYCFSAALQSDGKVVVGGISYPSFEVTLQRFNSNGGFDSSFGVNGQTVIPFQDIRFGKGLAIDQDGKILLTGSGYYFDGTYIYNKFMIIRFLSNGLIDTSFGANGTDTLSFGDAPQEDFATSIIAEQDGKIMVAGNAVTDDDATNSIAIARLNENGTLDSTFAVNGKLTTLPDAYPVNVASLAVSADGNIFVCGTQYSIGNFIVLKYNSNGMLDSSFNSSGIFKYAVGPGSCNSMVIQPEGKIILTGGKYSDFTESFITLRITGNGIIDNSFGNQGITTTSFTGMEAMANSVTLQPDGKIVVVGTATKVGDKGNFAIARYLNDLITGTLDFSRQNTFTLIYPNPIHSTETLQYSLSQDENLSINLYDVSGRLVQSFFTNQNRIAGDHSEQLNFNSSLPVGNYVLVISNGKNRVSIKVVKQ